MFFSLLDENKLHIIFFLWTGLCVEAKIVKLRTKIPLFMIRNEIGIKVLFCYILVFFFCLCIFYFQENWQNHILYTYFEQ